MMNRLTLMTCSSARCCHDTPIYGNMRSPDWFTGWISEMTITHMFHAARARSLFVERIIWVVVRSGRWKRVLVAKRGDHVLAAFRNGVRMF